LKLETWNLKVSRNPSWQHLLDIQSHFWCVYIGPDVLFCNCFRTKYWCFLKYEWGDLLFNGLVGWKSKLLCSNSRLAWCLLQQWPLQNLQLCGSQFVLSIGMKMSYPQYSKLVKFFYSNLKFFDDKLKKDMAGVKVEIMVVLLQSVRLSS
jgi:hypothetical protein